MSKKIEFKEEAKQKLLEGASKLAEAVTATLGPSGRNVLFTDGNGEIRSTKDGVSVAKSISLEDPIENMGAEILKQAALKTATQAGDGTTTTTLLAYHMMKKGLHVLGDKVNATQVKREIDLAIKEVIAQLKLQSEDITSEEQLKQIATISANNDEATGNLIAEALSKVGKEGVVSIEESKQTGETYLDTVEGMQFDHGYKSPFFVTNNNTMQCVLDDAYVLIFDGIISKAKEIVPILEYISQVNKPLLIVAEDIGDEALSTLIVNKLSGTIKVCAVKSPEFGERRTMLLEDMAVLTGGTLISKAKGMTVDKTQSTQLGVARKITITKDKTTIIDGKGDETKIRERAQEIKDQLDKSTSNFEREKLQERLAKLTAGIAVVYVGGANDIEIKEYKDRVEDALYATKAAVEEGILPGGGIALLKVRGILKGDKRIGYQIVYETLAKPFQQILNNAGVGEDSSSIQDSIMKKRNKWIGYDLKSNKFADFKALGILDPTKVIRIALENAGSVAGTLLLTEAVVYTPPKAKEDDKSEAFGGY